MSDILPWYVVGPLMGLTVAGLYMLTNTCLGISGSYVQVVDYACGRSIETWRPWNGVKRNAHGEIAMRVHCSETRCSLTRLSN